MSGLTFILLTFLTFYLIWSFYYGYRKNVKLAREISKIFEKFFDPIDKTYTWLGGAIGFRAIYRVKDKFIKQILLNLRLQPRQSVLYFILKLIILRGIKDNIQLLFYLNKKINYEFHAIKEKYNPKIFSTNLKEEKNEKYRFLYSSNYPKILKELSIDILEATPIKHIAITPDRKVVYFDLDFKNLEDIKNTLEKIKLFLEKLKIKV